MSKEIINKIANSRLITIDLKDYLPKENIITLDLKKFLINEMAIKEKKFRNDLKEFDFSIYKNKVVAIECNSDAIIPMWAYMLLTSYINQFAYEIYFGSSELVFQKLFLKNIENINPLNFKNEKVIIKGCGDVKINEELYIMITKKLQKHVSSLMFGEACSAVPVYKKK